MPPRPLHHWKSFWLGLIVLVFLGWAWGRSRGESDIFQWNSRKPPGFIGASNSDGAVGVFWAPWPGHGMSQIGYHHNHLDFRSPLFRPIFRCLAEDRYNGIPPQIIIAHWFLILLFLLPWTIWLFWRVRRMKRLASEPGSAGLQTVPNGP